MNPSRALISAALLAASVAACAAKKTSDPAQIPFDIGFPSAQAAAQVDDVLVSVYPATTSCAQLEAAIKTSQQLPPAILQSPAITPCELLGGKNNTFDLDVNNDYTMLAIGQMAGNDVFIGCAVQHAYGTQEALSIPLAFIDGKAAPLAATTCTKLSDKCSGACK